MSATGGGDKNDNGNGDGVDIGDDGGNNNDRDTDNRGIRRKIPLEYFCELLALKSVCLYVGGRSHVGWVVPSRLGTYA